MTARVYRYYTADGTLATPTGYGIDWWRYHWHVEGLRAWLLRHERRLP